MEKLTETLTKKADEEHQNDAHNNRSWEIKRESIVGRSCRNKGFMRI
jgi:hypothetical protein